jgi:hypothetical protein
MVEREHVMRTSTFYLGTDICTGVGATSHCVYLPQLFCWLNRVTADGILTGMALMDVRAEGCTCDAGLGFAYAGGYCEYVLPKPAILGTDAKCEISA